MGHSLRPHPCVSYITNDITSSGSDTNGNPTGKYASSASKLTSIHIHHLTPITACHHYCATTAATEVAVVATEATAAVASQRR